MPDNPQNTLYLIDGHAQIFRAYFAIRNAMTSPVTGEPTQAVFGVTGMLLKLFNQFRPNYVVMAVDMPGPTFRKDIYPEYKANRSEPPEDLPGQITRVIEVTKLFGIPVIGIEGYEADDVIATITDKILDDPAHQDVNIRIVSKDKDLEQLLSDRVTMFDIHKDELIDTAALLDKKGITPEQVIDMLTLTGDTIDNIPGVDGVGPKTAIKLLQDFGSLDGIYENIDQIKGKRRENLEKAKDHLPLSKTLVTLKHDVELDFSMDHAKVGAVDAAAIKRTFNELGFHRHQADLDRLLSKSAPASASQPTPAESSTKPAAKKQSKVDEEPNLFANTLFDAGPAESAEQSNLHDDSAPLPSTASNDQYTLVTTKSELDKLTQSLASAEIISIDTETVGLGQFAELCGICLSTEPGTGYYIPTKSPTPEKHLDQQTVIETLRPILEEVTIPKTGHNLKYDLLILRRAGINMQGLAFDTMIASHLLNSPGHSLDALSLALLNHTMIPITELIGPRERGKQQKTMDQVPLETITTYAAEDADISLKLYHLMKPKLDEQDMQTLAAEVEMPLVDVLTEMEYHGITVDRDELAAQKTKLAARIDELRDAIHDAAGEPFNIDSPKQLAAILFEKLELPIIKKTKTGASTDVEVLEKLADHDDLTGEQKTIPRLMLEYRQLAKLVNTYLESLAEAINPTTNRVHASFHQGGAATGRLSSSNPNLQNIPIRTELGKQVRKAFIAEPKHQLICADYSQIELRILAHLSQDPGLLDAFAKDMDIHTAVAAQVFDLDPDDVTSEQRAQAKSINFGIVYGISAFGLSRNVDNLDMKSAQALIDDYKSRFAGIDQFLAKCIDQATQFGYVTTILGRRRDIPQITSTNNQTRSLGERLAINTVVQGSAADLIKKAMVNLHQRITEKELPLKMLLQIHDELVLETPTKQAKAMTQVVKQEMENAMQLSVPLKVDITAGQNWLEAK